MLLIIKKEILNFNTQLGAGDSSKNNESSLKTNVLKMIEHSSNRQEHIAEKGENGD